LTRSPVWRIFISISILIIFLTGGINLFLSKFLDNIILHSWQRNLETEARLIAMQISPLLEEGVPGKLDDLVAQLSNKFDFRITILPKAGPVIDSTKNLLETDNPFNMPEVQDVQKNGSGYRIRYDPNFNTEALYVAVPVQGAGNNYIGIVRLAVSLNNVNNDSASMDRVIIITSVSASLIAILLAVILRLKFVRPLRNMTSRLLSMQKIDSIPSNLPGRYDEIGQLDKAISRFTMQLNTQIDNLQAEQEKFSAVLSQMTDGILIVDSGGKVQLINPAAEGMFNTSSPEALGKTITEVVRQHQLYALWQESQQSGLQQFTNLETSPDRLSLQAIATPLGEALPGHTLLIFQDLTRIRRLEMVRRYFISNVSHELRTPLASLKALAETLSEGALEDPPAARRFLNRMDNEIDNLTQMVQELLELSRIESGRVPLERRHTNPCDLINVAVERMILQAERAKINIQIICPDRLPPVMVDPYRMGQVLINLIHNAIKFTSPGGQIILSASMTETHVVFSIKDNGIGIAPQELERIFERFYKEDRARSGGGTGLGLSIARHLVEAHGGRIWADSTPGEGSTFFFSLPIK
jgi:two-component system phosphate regulon sensor histidine kinase PhoR